MSQFFYMEPEWLSSAERIGILGGTFDPIHFGHLVIAEEARVRYALNAVLFIPTGEPPHKPQWQANAEQRFLMTTLATDDNPLFFVSRIEIDRPGTSYTIDTVRALRDKYHRTEFYLIIGADSALEFYTWREPMAIIDLSHVVVATRPGYPVKRMQSMKKDPRLADMDTMPVPGLDISSTSLRSRVRAGRGLRYLVPDAVAAFIAKENLYTGDDDQLE